jgi:predicted TIM-barrel fold metal-dependent hydrolase
MTRASSRTTAAAWPLYEVDRRGRASRRLFHSGQTGVGAGHAGRGRHAAEVLEPDVHLDDVAVDFPDMPIILAHPSVPWQDEALAVAGAQAAGLHRPVRLVADVLPGAASSR